MIPGEIITKGGDIVLNEGRETTVLDVSNTGDRPVQVGSHFHFAETNPALPFDRDAARGKRLDIAAGSAVRFEPGQTREVTLVPYGGAAQGLWLQRQGDGRALRPRPPGCPRVTQSPFAFGMALGPSSRPRRMPPRSTPTEGSWMRYMRFGPAPAVAW